MSADTSAEALDRLLYQARYCPTLTDADWEEWRATLRALAAERDALAAKWESAEVDCALVVGDRDRLAADVARLRGALEPLLRHASMKAMDELIEEGGRIVGWQKTSQFMVLTEAARAALGDTP